MKRWQISGPMLLAIALLASFGYGAEGGDAIIGLWNTADRDAKIEIYKCEARYCGRISYLREPDFSPNDQGGMAGLPKVDRHNPNPELRNRSLVGLTIIEGFRYAGNNRWKGGRIYNPEDGRKYKAKITLAQGNLLQLRGYLGISLLGRTETWTR